MKNDYTEKDVLRLHAEGHSIRQIADKTGMSKSSVGRMVKKPQQSPGGTAPGTRPTTVPHQASQTVNGTGKTASGTPEKGQNSELAHTEASQQDTQQAEGSGSSLTWEFFLKREVTLSLRGFLSDIDAMLSGDQRDSAGARLQFSIWQARVWQRIFLTSGVCAGEGVDYDGSFAACVLERLHAYLWQQPVLERTKREHLPDVVRVKKDPFIELLLKLAKGGDLFAPRQDYAAFFTDVRRR